MVVLVLLAVVVVVMGFLDEMFVLLLAVMEVPGHCSPAAGAGSLGIGGIGGTVVVVLVVVI